MWKIIHLVGVGAVGIDTHESHALPFKPVYCLPGDLIGSDHVRTVITGEKDDQELLLEVG
jgi:hypothetical protein